MGKLLSHSILDFAKCPNQLSTVNYIFVKSIKKIPDHKTISQL